MLEVNECWFVDLPGEYDDLDLQQRFEEWFEEEGVEYMTFGYVDRCYRFWFDYYHDAEKFAQEWEDLGAQ